VPDPNRVVALRRVTVLCAAIALTTVAFTAVAQGATTPPTPESLTICGGTVSHDPSGAAAGEPNLLDYKFSCNSDISAYTIIVDQQSDPGGSIDDYNPSPTVFASDGVTPSTSESLTCEGTTPSDGINCNAGAGGVLSVFDFADGSIDPIQTYCKHLPAKARAGTAAVPQAVVQLVVTDSTGAEDGPFNLGPAKRCPKVPNFAPKPSAKHKAAKRHATKR
jgi:hypothetical protein